MRSTRRKISQCGGADRAVLPDALEAHGSLRTKSKYK